MFVIQNNAISLISHPLSGHHNRRGGCTNDTMLKSERVMILLPPPDVSECIDYKDRREASSGRREEGTTTPLAPSTTQSLLTTPPRHDTLPITRPPQHHFGKWDKPGRRGGYEAWGSGYVSTPAHNHEIGSVHCVRHSQVMTNTSPPLTEEG